MSNLLPAQPIHPLRRACCALLAIAGTLAMTGCSKSNNATSGAASGRKMYTVCLLPKEKDVPYFTSCAVGARQAAKQLGDVKLIYDGPVHGAATKAAAMIHKWTLQGVNVIAVSPNDPNVLAPAMKRAMQKGVHVITWDADGLPGTREYFVNQASARRIGYTLMDTLAKDIGPHAKGQIAIITATLTAANQNAWIHFIKIRLGKYPGLKLVSTQPSHDDQRRAFQITQHLLQAYPNLKGIIAVSSAAFPGAAEAIRQAGKTGQVQVTGLSTPDDMRAYVLDGTVKSVILWNTHALGALTIRVAEALASGKLKAGQKTFNAGPLGVKKIVGHQVLLGPLMVFNKKNIGKYHF